MSWIERGQWLITEPETLLPIDFTSRLVIVVSDVAGYRSTWKYAGFCYQYWDLPEIGLTRLNRKINVAIDDPVLFVPEIFTPNYALKFICADWIDALTLTLYEDSMPYYPPDTTNGVTASSTIVTSVSVASNTVPISLLVANSARKRFSFRNKGTKPALIGFANNFTAGTAYLTLAAGGVYESDIAYTGEIFALGTAASQTTDIAVIEFI